MDSGLKRRFFLLFLIVSVCLGGCGALRGLDPVGGGSSPAAGRTETPTQAVSPFDVYFSTPGGSSNPQTDLVRSIQNAQKTIAAAMFSISLPDVCDALVAAHKRGVEVRLVMETETINGECPRRLESSGIRIVDDRLNGLMHNKFVVIDGKEVWTGSMNLTRTGAYTDHNNLVRIPSIDAASYYLVEFDEMYREYLFGPGGRTNPQQKPVEVDGKRVEIYFSPEDDTAARIVELLNQAETSIHFLTFSFTSDEIAGAMLLRWRSGVDVRGVFDREQAESNKGTEYPRLKQFGLDVRLDNFDGALHDKVILIDGKIVITGSYNFGYNAENINDENLVILWDEALAARFEQEFERVFSQSDR